jgi:ABC-type lipoprotein export system ATPase subunit/bifunctional DNA-binding transcriptional regulator/antitoxin component of YhaV-PrlF toxin-antitoxin module
MALQGLDLEVARGEMLGVIGASGSGKSTLMNILGGLDRPSAGRIWVDGNDLLKMSYEAINEYRRTKVGFVWQQGARNLIPYLTALENVRLPVTIRSQSWSKERPRVEALLDAVGLSDRKHHRLSELSGGEQQRVAIAVALANDPVLLLADEPTGEVDTATAIGIFQILKDLNLQYGLTTVIVSHDLEIAHHVDRVVAIRDGKTSSETVRQSAQGTELKAGEAMFKEFVLLDSAGRLQVPREYLEQFNIQGRVVLEAVEDGILIRPVKSNEMENRSRPQEAGTSPEPEQAERQGLRGWWKRLRGGGGESQ